MDLEFLSQTALFRGAAPQEVAGMLECLRAERRVYEKDSVIYRAGDTVTALGLVLSLVAWLVRWTACEGVSSIISRRLRTR